MQISGKIAAMAAVFLFSGTASAVGTVADVTVYDRIENRVLPVYRHDGRFYVVGKPGNEYQIRVRNRGGADILAVMAVDGVNVVSGETANWDQTGYVLGAHQRYAVEGWRKSLERIAAFFFTEHENSYAARTGRPNHVGVIGVALFRKKAEPEAMLPRYPLHRDRAEDAAANAESPSAPAAAESQGAAADSTARSAAPENLARQRPAPAKTENKLGTGHGRSVESHVTMTDFERATPAPAEVITIYYDTYRNLVAQGVIRAPRLALPSAFPGQFAPDPR